MRETKLHAQQDALTALVPKTTTARCCNCGQTKPQVEFCKDRAYYRKTYKGRSHLISDPILYRTWRDLNGNRCAICGAMETEGQKFAVDHCHATGCLRGLLCPPCNLGLGSFRDDPERLRKAAKYVEGWATKREL